MQHDRLHAPRTPGRIASSASFLASTNGGTHRSLSIARPTRCIGACDVRPIAVSACVGMNHHQIAGLDRALSRAGVGGRGARRVRPRHAKKEAVTAFYRLSFCRSLESSLHVSRDFCFPSSPLVWSRPRVQIPQPRYRTPVVYPLVLSAVLQASICLRACRNFGNSPSGAIAEEDLKRRSKVIRRKRNWRFAFLHDLEADCRVAKS